MILSDEEVEARINSPENLTNRFAKSELEVRQVHTQNRGAEIPQEVRKLITGLAVLDQDTNQSIADTFDIDKSTVGKMSKGIISDRLDDELVDVKEKVAEKRIEDAHELAIDALMDCLTGLKPALKEEKSASKLSKIATDMSRITANLKPKDQNDDRRVQVVVMTVNQHKESSYDAIEVN